MAAKDQVPKVGQTGAGRGRQGSGRFGKAERQSSSGKGKKISIGECRVGARQGKGRGE